MNNIADDIYGAYYEGLRDGALRWFKTVDILPTKDDAGIDGMVAFCYRDEWDCFNRLEKWNEISPQKHTYWHKMLKAPEVEE